MLCLLSEAQHALSSSERTNHEVTSNKIVLILMRHTLRGSVRMFAGMALC